MPKLDLSDIALCAPDSANVSLTVRALNISATECAFGDIVLLSDVSMAGAFRHVRIDRLTSKADYSAFVIKSLPNHVQLPFALVMQWDGYVIDPDAWLPEFRHYDYIGAKWAWHKDGLTVGNGGFSLRSQKLLRTLALPRFELPHDVNEDVYICRMQRSVLESDYGIRFAPEAVADRFSYEGSQPDAPTFGFHGLWNMWRHVDDAGLVIIAKEIGNHYLKSREYAEIIVTLFQLRRFIPLIAFYTRLRAERSAAAVSKYLMTFVPNKQLISHCVGICEMIISQRAGAESSAPDL